MAVRLLRTAAAVALVVACAAACGDDSTGDDDRSSPDTESSESPGPAAPDGTYKSEVGPNEEAVTLEVEDGTITHLEGKAHGECEGVTTSESIEGDVDIPIEDDAVDYQSEANGATTILTGEFTDGTFEGTFSYGRADATCPTEPFTFSASVS